MKQEEIFDKIDFKKMEGLIPVIIQDYESKNVLTLAYTNKEALYRTFKTGYAHYYRRSMKKVMKKGITSGNIQKIIRIFLDCDRDSLLFQVHQTGDACHCDSKSCFYVEISFKSPLL